MPKSSTDSFTPISRNWRKVARTLSRASSHWLSVNSSSSCAAGRLSASAERTTSSRSPWRNWWTERFTETRRFRPRWLHSAACRRPGAGPPISPINPHSSARPMKVDGGIMPSSGWCQRTSASTESGRALARHSGLVMRPAGPPRPPCATGFPGAGVRGCCLQVVAEELEGIAAELLGMLHRQVRLAHQHGDFPCLLGKQADPSEAPRINSWPSTLTGWRNWTSRRSARRDRAAVPVPPSRRMANSSPARRARVLASGAVRRSAGPSP